MSSPASQSPSTTTTTTNPLRPLYFTLLLACPLLLAVPPRKLDLYTFSLTGAFVVSAEELYFGSGRRNRGGIVGSGTGSTGVMGVLGRADMQDGTKAEGGKGEGTKGAIEKLWMGQEKAGWQRRRIEEEKEKLEDGEGYGDIILAQVREVFSSTKEGEQEEAEEGRKG